MSRAGTVAKALVVVALVSIAVGLYVLIPHLRADRFTPVVLHPDTEDDSSELLIQVSGAVADPGLYTVDRSTSVGELIDLAGADAADHSLHLSVDEQAGSDTFQRVDLNHADAWLLEALPGIGEDRANSIISYRNLHGPFSCIEELALVPGIGETTFQALREYITVTP